MTETQTITRDQVNVAPATGKVQVIFPVVQNPKPKALVVHCADVRFRRAFRNFIEGDTETGCLGFKEEEYVSLVIPGGVSSLSEVLTLPKQFKVAKEQIESITDHFPTITHVVLINHEDCAPYETLRSKIGAAFLRRVSSLLERQQIDLVQAAKTIMGFGTIQASVEVYMAKFANQDHTQVTFETIQL